MLCLKRDGGEFGGVSVKVPKKKLEKYSGRAVGDNRKKRKKSKCKRKRGTAFRWGGGEEETILILGNSAEGAREGVS